MSVEREGGEKMKGPVCRVRGCFGRRPSWVLCYFWERGGSVVWKNVEGGGKLLGGQGVGCGEERISTPFFGLGKRREVCWRGGIAEVGLFVRVVRG